MAAVKAHWIQFAKSILFAAGVLWLPLEAYEGLSNEQVNLPFLFYVAMAMIFGIAFFTIDGFFVAGFLKKRITIKSNSFNTKINVKFGDIFTQDGWKAIGVNDFFDSVVDGDLVSGKSLHGHVISTYWPGDNDSWQQRVNKSLQGKKFKERKRKNGHGNKRRYPIGTTATVKANSHSFLFVALSKTCTDDNVVAASAERLIRATRGMLKQARIVCANEPLQIPLMGSGLGRVGIQNAIMVDLILAAIFEETTQAKITDSITIVLPKDKSADFDLGAISRDWS